MTILSKHLKPGTVVRVTNDGRRAVDASQGHAETVLYAFPVRIGGKGGTEVTFTNGITVRTPANAHWIEG